jgi:hypothetical protein
MMQKHVLPLLALAAIATPAAAGNRVFVASNGNDANACTQAAPCATFAKAITTAGANGAVICLDRGTYHQSTLLTITTSLSILCGKQLGDIGDGRIKVITAATDTVVLEGLVSDLQGAASQALGFNGAGTLHIRNSNIQNSGADGLGFAPTGASTLFITNSVFSGHVGGHGLQIRPIGGYANVHLLNVQLDDNKQSGLNADGTQSSFGINVNIVGGSARSNKVNGILAVGTASSPTTTVSVMGMQITGNLNFGVGATNSPTGIVKIGNSQITANASGVGAAANGRVFSLGGNQVHSNSVNGSFSGSIPTQ